MAPKQHWEVDPFNDREIWIRLIGDIKETPRDTAILGRKIFEGIVPGFRCLEVGAGVGRLLLEASQHFDTAVYGVDSSVSMVAASTRYLLATQRCRVILTDGVSLPFHDDHFDFVYSYTCFQHMPTLAMIRANLKEIFRVLRRGAKCRIQTVRGENGNGRHDGYVFRSVTDLSVEFVTVGFNEVNITLEGEWLWATATKSGNR